MAANIYPLIRSRFYPAAPAVQNHESQAENLHRAGRALWAAGLYERALASIGRAIALDPHVPAYHHSLGQTLHRLARFSDAALCYQEALRLEPSSASVLNDLGAAFMEGRRFPEAVSALLDAIAIRPGFPEAFNNLGSALREQGQYDEAITCYGEALRLRPGYAQAHNNLGTAFEKSGRLEEALAEYGWAVRLDPGYAQARFNRAAARLLKGDFERGWKEFEWRFQAAGHAPRQSTAPLWDGSPLQGRRILLHAEQGLGDTLQFVRYAGMVKQRGGVMILQCQPRLVELLRTVQGIDEIAAGGMPAHDCHAPLLSLPLLFHTLPETVPAPVPYIRPDPALAAKWAERLGRKHSLRVGLVWAGNPNQLNDRYRSMSLAQLAPLASIEGVQLFSLQKGEKARELLENKAGWRIARIEPEDEGIAGTAAMIENLDLVITVDTMVAHLAGALAKPVWTMLPFAPDWRWLLDRNDSPWYPTMRLFRQPRPGDWESVVHEVSEALRARVAAGIRGPLSLAAGLSPVPSQSDSHERGPSIRMRLQSPLRQSPAPAALLPRVPFPAIEYARPGV